MKAILPLVLALALQAGSAFAHAGLVSASPAAGAAVEAPQSVVLTFTETISAALSGVTVTAADGSTIATGTKSLDADGVSLTIPLTDHLAPGDYSVAWHALSDDGHKSQGTFTFTVK